MPDYQELYFRLLDETAITNTQLLGLPHLRKKVRELLEKQQQAISASAERCREQMRQEGYK